MNPQTTAFIGIVFTVVGWVVMILWNVFRGGKEVGSTTAAYDEKFRNLTQDIQNLHEAMSANNEMHNENYRDFYREFTSLRLKIAKELGINGGD